jgi:phage gp36-like protein
MAYATVDGVIVRYKPLNSMIGTGTLDITTTDIASIYIADAESYMNAFLSARYVVPVATEPLVTMLCADIAIYKILEDRAPRIPDFMQNRWSAANSFLSQLANGGMALTGSNQIVSSGGDEEVWSNVLENPSGPVFQPVEAFSHHVSSRWCEDDGWGGNRGW